MVGDSASRVDDLDERLGAALVSDLDGDPSLQRELEGVAEEVEQDLLEQVGSARARGSVRVLQAGESGKYAREVDGLLLEWVGLAFDDELDAAAFDGRSEERRKVGDNGAQFDGAEDGVHPSSFEASCKRNVSAKRGCQYSLVKTHRSRAEC